MRRILVAVDGSECSQDAAAYAIHLAQSQGADVIFLYVVDNQLMDELGQRRAALDEDHARERLREQGRMCLQSMVRLAEECAVPHTEALAEGDPGALICETAAAQNADAIVVGKIGRRGARRILMGSITRRVIESTDRPVIVVTAPGHG
jgi:nucleotide-binding universal stress UspA family protein